MAVHKSDRAAVRKLLAKNKQLAKRRSVLVKRVLALRGRANAINLEASGLMTSADELEREINSNDAAIRGYSFGG